MFFLNTNYTNRTNTSCSSTENSCYSRYSCSIKYLFKTENSCHSRNSCSVKYLFKAHIRVIREIRVQLNPLKSKESNEESKKNRFDRGTLQCHTY